MIAVGPGPVASNPPLHSAGYRLFRVHGRNVDGAARTGHRCSDLVVGGEVVGIRLDRLMRPVGSDI
jgi:hypothetical protein